MTRLAPRFVLILIMVVGLVGCGTGGGNSEITPIKYTGSIDPALIDSVNAQKLIMAVYEGGGAGVSAGGIASVNTGGSNAGTSSTIALARTLDSAVRKMDFSKTQSGGSGAKRAFTYSDSIPGLCGGTAYYTITIDDVTGNFSGTMTFASYCESGAVLNGNMNFSGHIDLYGTGLITNFDISTSALSTSIGSVSFTMSGSISYTFTASTMNVVMNMAMRDDTTMEVGLIENMDMTFTDYVTYGTMAVNSVRAYDHVHGYVDCQTTSALAMNYADSWPYTGTLECAGAVGGSGGNTAVRLVVISNTQYYVEADTDGDGVFEFATANLNWADL